MNVEELVSALTLEEKAGLCSGADFWHTKAVERLGIPAIKVSDGPHGLRTQKEGSTDPNDAIEAVCFPAGCAAAASFDPALTRRMGAALGREARASGVQVLLGPAVNIKRSPLCGRNFEYYSEDPYLAGELAAGFIQGVQSEGVGTSIKHFAANSQETRRLSADSRVDERTLHEIYLPAFETAVKKARPWTVMCSYNRVNGDYASENKPLLTDILRDDWGFGGFVMSDWGAVNDRVKGVAAGLELEMPGSGGVYDRKIIEAVQNGTLDIGVLDKAVARILNIVLRAADLAKLPAVFDHAADHKLAVELAKQSAVLLRNLGALPLHKGQKVAYIGAFADHPRYQGGGSSHVNTTAISAMDAAIMNDRRVSYIEGFPADRDQRDEAEFLRAVTAAEAAGCIRIYAGLAETVVGRTLLLIGEHGICLTHLFELRLSGFIAGVAVRVVLHGKATIRFLDLVLRCPALDAEHLIVVLFSHGLLLVFRMNETLIRFLYVEKEPLDRIPPLLRQASSFESA